MNIDGVEIERRFLIRYPAEHILALCCDFTDIVQIYLLSKKGITERVRKRGKDGSYTYTHTVKRRVSDMRRLEDEREISEDLYLKLLENSDPGRHPINKKRYCLEYGNRLFEIDLFSFWNDRAIMEVELTDEQDELSVPPLIEIIKEVTGDKRYTNASLAKTIPHDII